MSSSCSLIWFVCYGFFFFQAEDGIRDLVRSRGLGDVYKRQGLGSSSFHSSHTAGSSADSRLGFGRFDPSHQFPDCLLYTSDAADERSSVDLGGRRIIKKKNKHKIGRSGTSHVK